MKKSQGISIRVIIISALALLVLVVLSVIFTGKAGKFIIESEDCATQAGVCRLFADETPNRGCEEGEFPHQSLTCSLSPAGKERVCCIGLTS